MTETPPETPPAVVETPAAPVPPVPVPPAVLTPATPAPPVEEKPPVETEEKEKPDPLLIDFADMLKATLDKEYPKELDKEPLAKRISIMKYLVQMKQTKKVEANVPMPGPPKESKKANKVNYKELGKKY